MAKYPRFKKRVRRGKTPAAHNPPPNKPLLFIADFRMLFASGASSTKPFRIAYRLKPMIRRKRRKGLRRS
jgi:hypothetical protein